MTVTSCASPIVGYSRTLQSVCYYPIHCYLMSHQITNTPHSPSSIHVLIVAVMLLLFQRQIHSVEQYSFSTKRFPLDDSFVMTDALCDGILCLAAHCIIHHSYRFSKYISLFCQSLILYDFTPPH